MPKIFLELILVLSLVACASRRKVEEAPAATPTPAPVAVAKPQIKYIYIDRTLPTESAMTMSPLEIAPPKEIQIWTDIARFLWPLMALLGAGIMMIAALYAEHLVIERLLAARRARRSERVSRIPNLEA